jgi:hypothetical protein
MKNTGFYDSILRYMEESEDFGNRLRATSNSLSARVLTRLISQEEIEHPRNEIVFGETTRLDENGNLLVEKKTIQIIIDSNSLKD